MISKTLVNRVHSHLELSFSPYRERPTTQCEAASVFLITCRSYSHLFNGLLKLIYTAANATRLNTYISIGSIYFGEIENNSTKADVTL